MKVSILIPTYNRSTLVCKTIESALQQSFNDFEIIVVDDGSTDDTSEKITRFGDDRIRYIKQPNGGISNARNHGLSVARGEYIATLDSDDLWQPDKLVLQVKILDSFPDVSYTFSNFSIYKNSRNIIWNGLQTWFETPMDWDRFYPHSISVRDLDMDESIHCPQDTRIYFGDLYHASLQNYYVLPSTALFRKSMIPEGVDFPEHDFICGDWDFFARLSKDHPVAYLDHETTHNRSHEDEYRLTRTSWKKQLELRIDMLERLYMQDRSFYERNKSEVDTVYKHYLHAVCRQYLLSGETREARAVLDKYRSHRRSVDIPYIALRMASYTPGICTTLKSLRSLRG